MALPFPFRPPPRSAARSSSARRVFLRAIKFIMTMPIEKPTIPTAKTIVTIRPEVVRWSSFFMQIGSPAVFVVHKLPAAQVPIAVIVGVQPIVSPLDIEQTDVDTTFVVEQRSVPVVVAAVVEPVVVGWLDVVELSLVVDEAVVSVVAVVEAAAEEAEESEVVVASVLEGAVVEAAADSVVFSVVFALVLAVFFSVVAASVVPVDSSLLLSSSGTSDSSYPLHSCANHIAPIVASASEQPPSMKHSLISSNLSKSTFAPRHLEIKLLSPQEFLLARSSKLSWAHWLVVAETNVTVVVSSAKIIDLMMN